MPTTISYRMAPSDHQSAARPWPVRVRISGAKYSGVPQKECAEILSWMPSYNTPHDEARGQAAGMSAAEMGRERRRGGGGERCGLC